VSRSVISKLGNAVWVTPRKQNSLQPSFKQWQRWGRRDIRWQPVPDTCGSHRKGSVTDGGETCRWNNERRCRRRPQPLPNQRQRQGEVAWRGTMAPSREDSDIRTLPAGSRYAVAYVASVSLAGVAWLDRTGSNGRHERRSLTKLN